MITASWRIDDAKLRSLESRLPVSARDMVNQLAIDAASIVRSNWSSRSPSDPGEPPAVVSGELDRSVHAETSGGGSRFSSKVVASARHGGFNEFGTVKMAARPFMLPAALMVESRIPDLARDAFQRAMG